jgi:hypothetical protein
MDDKNGHPMECHQPEYRQKPLCAVLGNTSQLQRPAVSQLAEVVVKIGPKLPSFNRVGIDGTFRASSGLFSAG